MAVEGVTDGQLIVESNPRTINGKTVYGIMPQHYKKGSTRTEGTEGSDGALHTKLVDANGNPLFSDTNKAKVADVDVLAKITELDTKIQGIIDGTTPANTSLTGSIVVKDDGEKTIVAGDYDYLASGLEMDEDWYSIGMYVGGGVDADLYIEGISLSPDLLQIYKIEELSTTIFNTRDIKGRFAVLGNKLSVRVTNNGSSDITIKYTIFGGVS